MPEVHQGSGEERPCRVNLPATCKMCPVRTILARQLLGCPFAPAGPSVSSGINRPVVDFVSSEAAHGYVEDPRD